MKKREYTVRLLNIEEIEKTKGFVWLEIRRSMTPERIGLREAFFVATGDHRRPGGEVIKKDCFYFAARGFQNTIGLGATFYGVDWRCWSGKPPERTMLNTEWAEEPRMETL